MKKYLKVITSACLFLFSSSLVAQETNVVENESLDCLLGTYSFVKFKHREHRGLGYDTGYSSLELFLTPSWVSQFQPIFNGQGHVFNNGDLAANVGIAGRIADSNENFAFGLNVFYDFRKRKNLKTSQAALGIEFLSNYLDFRMNGYLPVSGYATEVVNTSSTFGGFIDNTLLLNSTARFAFPSADAEIGGSIPTPFDYFSIYVATGPYYLFKQNATTISEGNAFGWRATAEFNVTDWFDIGAEYTYDRIYNSRFVGYASLNIPLGSRKRKSQYNCKRFSRGMRLKTQKIRRNEIIPMKKKETQVSLSGTHIVFVDNTGTIGTGTSTGSGEGTFECPYTNLVAAQDNSNPGDIIYTYPGDGTTKGYDLGISLQSDQTFQSSNQPITINGVFVPAQTVAAPKVTNTQGPAIELADSVIVSGITILTPQGHGIIGDSVKEFTISSCDITASNNMNGIDLNNLKGDFSISSNTFASNSLNQGNAINIGVVSGSNGTMNIENNTVNSGFKYALNYRDPTGTSAIGLDLNFSNNTVVTPLGSGIYIQELPGSSTVSVISNTLTTLADIVIENDNSSNLTTNFEIRNNTLTGGSVAFQMFNTIGQDYSVVITDNTANFVGDNFALPFLVQLENVGSSRVTMSRNTVTETGDFPNTTALQVKYDIPTGQTNTGTNILEYKNNTVTSQAKTVDAFKLQIANDIETLKAELHDNTSTTNAIGFNILQDNLGPDVCFDFKRNTAKKLKIEVPSGNDFSIVAKDGTEAGFKDQNPDIKKFDLSSNLTPANYVKKCSL